MAFIRVRDKDTRHEFDVPESDWRIRAGLFEPVKSDRYPAVVLPRKPKHHIAPAKAESKKEG